MTGEEDGHAANRALAEEIRHRLGECTATERRAALALLANYPMLGLGTVAQFVDGLASVGRPIDYLLNIPVPTMLRDRRSLVTGWHSQQQRLMQQGLFQPPGMWGGGGSPF